MAPKRPIEEAAEESAEESVEATVEGSVDQKSRKKSFKFDSDFRRLMSGALPQGHEFDTANVSAEAADILSQAEREGGSDATNRACADLREEVLTKIGALPKKLRKLNAEILSGEIELHELGDIVARAAWIEALLAGMPDDDDIGYAPNNFWSPGLEARESFQIQVVEEADTLFGPDGDERACSPD